MSKKSMFPLFTAAIDPILLNLQIRRKCIISWMYSNFGQLGQHIRESAALEHQKNPPWVNIMGENGVYSLFSLLCNLTYKRTIQHILMTCWLSGERLLPFGLLVIAWVYTLPSSSK